jgi:MFS family permease
MGFAPSLRAAADGLITFRATGAINLPESAIEAALDLSSGQWSVVVAAFTIGGLVGAQLSASFADKHGRKPFLVWHSIFFIAAGALQFGAGLVNFDSPGGRHIGFALLVIGRVLAGVGGGGATVVVPIFMNEIADTKVRGLFGALFQFTLVIAILASQVSRSPLYSFAAFICCIHLLHSFAAFSWLVLDCRTGTAGSGCSLCLQSSA